MSSPTSNNQDSNKIVEISAFKKKRETKEQIARGRKPLYMDHHKGSASGHKSHDSNDLDFADRLNKIRGSLDRINSLMFELKKLSSREAQKGSIN